MQSYTGGSTRIDVCLLTHVVSTGPETLTLIMGLMLTWFNLS